MTAATGTVDARLRSLGSSTAWLQRNTWTLGLLALLALLLAVTKVIQPNYGETGIGSLATSVLPLALAAVAQAIIVISGGIDLSIGSMMALCSVASARLMEDQTNEFGVAVVLGTLVLGMLLGLVNGTLVVLTRVPDIVVTLAMSFVWAGCALLVLPTPGGGSAEWLGGLISGPIARDSILAWVPKAAIVLAIVVALIWLPIVRSRLGLSLYAVGSNQLAAFRSGVSVGRTKVIAYVLGGLFAAFAGISLTAITGIGTPVPGPYTLQSVAAVVLGGVSLAGGRGGVFGAIIAVVILQLIRTDMTFLKVDTNLATVSQGAILIAVVMVGTLIQLRRSRA